MPGGLLNNKMGVKCECLRPRQRAGCGVDVRPACLHHAKRFISQQVGHHAPQEVRLGHKISVENGYKGYVRPGESFGQRAGFIAVTLFAADVRDLYPLRAGALGGSCGDIRGIVT